MIAAKKALIVILRELKLMVIIRKMTDRVIHFHFLGNEKAKQPNNRNGDNPKCHIPKLLKLFNKISHIQNNITPYCNQDFMHFWQTIGIENAYKKEGINRNNEEDMSCFQIQ